MAYTICTKYHLQRLGQATDSTYIKQIYKKNKHWNPEPAPTLVEDTITIFDKSLHKMQDTLNKKQQKINLGNLTTLQTQTLRTLKQNAHLTIKPTDKNLGPAILDMDSYIKQVLKEHLLTNNYRQLDNDSAKLQMANIEHELKALIKDNVHKLSKAEQLYFHQSFQQHHRSPIFYGLPKVHKVPVTLRPVVSSSSSFLSIFSNWLDYKMKDLLPLVGSYIKNSTTVLDDIRNIILPENTLLFLANAKSMYTNIDTPTGITAIRDFIAVNSAKLPPAFPTSLFLRILSYVMENNISYALATNLRYSHGYTSCLRLRNNFIWTPRE